MATVTDYRPVWEPDVEVELAWFSYAATAVPATIFPSVFELAG
jgi:hypothetical protein